MNFSSTHPLDMEVKMDREPITLNFYDENDEVIKTYSKARVSWGMWKRALEVRPAPDKKLTDDKLANIRSFVVDFFDGQFTEQELIEHADVEDILICTYQIAARVLSIMKREGVDLPEE